MTYEYKYQVKREKIRTKARFISGSAGLLNSFISDMEYLIEQVVDEYKEKRHESKITEVYEDLWVKLTHFKNIRGILSGIEEESEQIDTDLSEILFFIKGKTKIDLNTISKD